MTGAHPPQACGVGDYTARLAEALARRPGVEVGVLSSEGAVLATDAGLAAKAGTPVLLPGMLDWSYAELGRMVRTIREWSPDVLHLQYPTTGYGNGRLPFLTPLIGWLLGARVVRTWHEVTGWDRLRNWRNVLFFFLQAFVPGSFVIVRPNFDRQLHPVFRYLPWKRRYDLITSASAIPASKLSSDERARLRRKLAGDQSRLIVFFGFLYPQKGAELLFRIADPATDHIIVLGGLHHGGAYRQEIEELARSAPWDGKATIAGYRPEAEIADMLAAADAVILPFREGAGSWNTSLHAAMLQGTLVITTSADERGYDPARRIYFSAPDDVEDMRGALNAYARSSSETDRPKPRDEWARIVDAHLAVYKRKRWLKRPRSGATQR